MFRCSLAVTRKDRIRSESIDGSDMCIGGRVDIPDSLITDAESTDIKWIHKNRKIRVRWYSTFWLALVFWYEPSKADEHRLTSWLSCRLTCERPLLPTLHPRSEITSHHKVKRFLWNMMKTGRNHRKRLQQWPETSSKSQIEMCQRWPHWPQYQTVERHTDDKKTAHSVCEEMKPFKIAVLIKFAMNFSPL